MNYMRRKALGHKLEVSVVTAVATGLGVGMAAATAITGAGVMAAGSVLGIKEAKPIGGLMMAGGSIASGLGGLGMMGGTGAAAATGTLGTLSAGASLVGGALQGVGILTGNDKMANIGGLIGGAGMFGQSMTAGTAASGAEAGLSGGDYVNLGDSSKMVSGASRTGSSVGDALAIDAPAWSTPGINPSAGGVVSGGGTGAGGLVERIGKYDNYIKMAGDFATGMSNASAKKDQLGLEQQALDLLNKKNTAVAIPGSLPVSAGTPQAVAPIAQNRSTGLLNTTSQQVPGVA